MVIGRERTVAPTQPFCFLYGINQFVVTATPSPMDWNHAHFINKSLSFTDNTSRIYVNRGAEGIYDISASAGVYKTGGNPVEAILAIYINGVACEYSVAHGSVGAAAQHGDAYLRTIAYLHVGDYVETYISVDAGTGATKKDTVRFIMKGLHMQGWNNRRGGNNKYPFREDDNFGN